MPARDRFHELVKKALIKEGWDVTHDPYVVSIGLRTLFVDLGAHKLIAAEKKDQRIAVEVKSFDSPSFLDELEKLIGQIKLYDFALQKQEPDRKLYVAMPSEVYIQFIEDDHLKEFLTLLQFSYILYNTKTGLIEEWKNS